MSPDLYTALVERLDEMTADQTIAEIDTLIREIEETAERMGQAIEETKKNLEEAERLEK